MTLEERFEQENIAGEKIAAILHLRPFRNYAPPRYDTEDGNKTARALVGTIIQILEEHELITNQSCHE